FARSTAPVEGEPVTADHVAYVSPVAPAAEVPDLEDGFFQASLDLGNLAGERGRDQDMAPPRTGVVEGPGHYTAQAITAEVLVGQHLLTYFTYGVGTERTKRVGLTDGGLILV